MTTIKSADIKEAIQILRDLAEAERENSSTREKYLKVYGKNKRVPFPTVYSDMAKAGAESNGIIKAANFLEACFFPNEKKRLKA